LNAVAYRSLSSVGGGGGRNCVLDWIANGVAFGRKVNVAKLNAGGVGCQLPGVSGSTYVGSGTIVAGQPSFCRHSSTALATVCPMAIPCFSLPAGRFAN